MATERCIGTNYRLCPKHLRLRYMTALAHTRGLPAPSLEEFNSMFEATNGMICPDCGKKMTMFKSDGNAADTMTLQHYRHKPMGLVCQSCNTRHAFMEGDSFCDLPKGMKRCPGCKQILPFSAFRREPEKVGRFMNRRAVCRPCDNKRNASWIKRNRERYNENRRRMRERKRQREKDGATLP